MIASAQITNIENLAFIAALVFKLLSPKLFTNRKDIRTIFLKSRLLYKKIANFTVKLLQNYKYLEFEILGILLKHVSDHCFFNFHNCNFNSYMFLW